MGHDCCRLGRIAGQRGFLCNLKFYKNELLYRIRNRVHRSHIKMIGGTSKELMNKQLMVSFGKCLSGFTEIFELCCWDQIDRMEYD